MALKTAAEEKQRGRSLEKAIHTSSREQAYYFCRSGREAGLSVSYLYKYPEIKERIEILRKQQLK